MKVLACAFLLFGLAIRFVDVSNGESFMLFSFLFALGLSFLEVVAIFFHIKDDVRCSKEKP